MTAPALPPITDKDIKRVIRSWTHVSTRTETNPTPLSTFADSFYDNLFKLDENIKGMFANVDMMAQGNKLVDVLTLVVKNLENISSDEMQDKIRALGKRHAKKYHVTREMYQQVATALLAALEQSLGKRWKERTKHSWVVAYMNIAAVMQEVYTSDDLNGTGAPNAKCQIL